MIVCALYNIAVIVCFTLLAIHFDHWWIVLFSLLLFAQYHSEDLDNEENDFDVGEQNESAS